MSTMDLFGERSVLDVYHGTNMSVPAPCYSMCKDKNDYGIGFYLTEDIEQGEDWAYRSAGASVLNYYQLNTKNLIVCDLNKEGPLVWIATLLRNRKIDVQSTGVNENDLNEFIKKYAITLEGFNIVKGYRADDSYTNIVYAFLNNTLSADHVVNCFYKGSLGQQICIKDQSTMDILCEHKSTILKDVVKQKRAVNRDRGARKQAKDLISTSTKRILKEGRSPNEIYFYQTVECKYTYNSKLKKLERSL